MLQKILYPLRLLHGKLYEWRKSQIKNIKYRRLLRHPLGKKVYVIGTPSHSNVGDSAIVLAQIAFLKKCGFSQKRIKEISFNEYLKESTFIRKHISKRHLIAQLGGGNMGNQWMNEENFHRQLVVDFPNNPQVIFPQTIYFTDDEKGHSELINSQCIYNSSLITIVARETTSHKIFNTFFGNINLLLTPDIVLSSNKDNYEVSTLHRENIMLCMRNDCERSIKDEDFSKLVEFLNTNSYSFLQTDMHTDRLVTKENRFQVVQEKMNEFSAARLVITDRLHGMIFAAITETPCIVLNNYNHKVHGTYDWISHLPYIRFAHNVDEAIRLIPEMLEIKNCVFDNASLIPQFQKLAEVVKKHAPN